MPRYRLLQPHDFRGVYYNKGEVVDYDGPPSKQMELVDQPPPAAPETPGPEAEQESKSPKKSKHRDE